MVMAITSDNIPLSESTPLAAVTARSELSRVDCKSIERTAAGIVITIPKSKTDQEGQARQVAIPRGQNAICPVKALDQWLEVSGISEGPVFRPVTRRGHVLSVKSRATPSRPS